MQIAIFDTVKQRGRKVNNADEALFRASLRFHDICSHYFYCYLTLQMWTCLYITLEFKLMSAYTSVPTHVQVKGSYM